MTPSLENYRWGLPVAASTFAAEIDFGIRLIHVAMFAIFISWGIFFAYLLFRYRRRPRAGGEVPRAEYGEHRVAYSLIPDGLVALFEVALIVFYAVPAWARIKQTMPPPEAALPIRVEAQQFAWNIHYPGPDLTFGRRDPKFISPGNVLGLDPGDPAGKDDIVSINQLHLPLGRPAVVRLTSRDVIHSLFIPEFRIKQDAVPGMEIPVWFEPIKEGKYEIGCAQLCGAQHAFMRGDVIVQAEAEFQKWLRQKEKEKREGG